MSWTPVALRGQEWNPTRAQRDRLHTLGDIGQTRVYTCAPGSVIAFTETSSGDLRLIEVIEPEPTHLILYDTGAREAQAA